MMKKTLISYTSFASIEKKYKFIKQVIENLSQKIEKNPNQTDISLEVLSDEVKKILDLVFTALMEESTEHCYDTKRLNLLVISVSKIFEKYLKTCQKAFTADGLNKDNYVLYQTCLDDPIIKFIALGNLLRKNKAFQISLGHVARVLCYALSDLGEIYLKLKKADFALYTYNGIDDWLKCATPHPIKPRHYNDNLKLDTAALRTVLSVKRHYGLYKFFQDQNRVAKAQHYFERVLKDSDVYFDPEILEDIYNSASFLCGQYKYIQACQTYVNYCDYWKKAKTELLIKEAAAEYACKAEKFQTHIIPLIKSEMFNRNEMNFQISCLKNISVKFNATDFSCHVSLKCSLDSNRLYSLGLKKFKHSIKSENSFTIYNCDQYERDAFEAFFLALEESLQEKRDRLEEGKKSLSYLCESMHTLTLRTAPQPDPTPIATGLDLAIFQPKTKSKEPPSPIPHQEAEKKKNEQIFDLSGPNIPKGIFYAYGINLGESANKVAVGDWEQYQSLLVNRNMVSKEAKLRMVCTKKNDVKEIAFKIVDPAKKCHVLLEFAEAIKDEKKDYSKYFYRLRK